MLENMILPKVVLFIDDDADDRAIFSEATSLVDPTIQRLYATNGLEALQLLSQENAVIPDLIFLDINMPVMNGLECLVELKQMEALRHTPIIICSTSIYTGDQEQFEAQGADFYLVKPNTLLKMSTALQFVFSKYQNKKVSALAQKALVA
jgi:CheY-like chemotaxis protein